MQYRRVPTIINGKEGYIMARKGRKPKKDAARHNCGKVIQPTPEQKEKDVRSVVMNNPERRHYKEMGRSQLAGYPLGRMVLSNEMTRQQVSAIERAGNIIGRYLLTIPDAKINGKGPSWARFTKDDLGTEHAPHDPVDGAPETELDREIRAKDAFDRLQWDLIDGGFASHQRLITRTHLMLLDVYPHEIGELRLMANHLDRVWKARREI